MSFTIVNYRVGNPRDGMGGKWRHSSIKGLSSFKLV
uniref:Uncharacterized protein n=1 Tax=Arundo donax TaxID=35708 RepID=A0A0A9FB26_ARUDO